MTFRVAELRKERGSTLSVMIAHLYDDNPFEAILYFDLSPHYYHNEAGTLVVQERPHVMRTLEFVSDMQKKFHAARLLKSPSNELSAAGLTFSYFT